MGTCVNGHVCCSVGKLGAGSYAQVFKAVNVTSGVFFAIKVPCSIHSLAMFIVILISWCIISFVGNLERYDSSTRFSWLLWLCAKSFRCEYS
jgi:hypothetical protein